MTLSLRNAYGAVLLRLFIVLAAVFLLAMGTIAATSAHAALETSAPVGGDVLPTAPTEISATYTERLEQSYSRLQLFDATGTEIEGTSLSFGADGYSMMLAVPAGLPNGTYSVLWRTLSQDDGHTASNYFSFTVGSNADIAPVVIPTDLDTGGSAPQWAKTLSRWAALLGLAAMIGCWPVWSLVIRPSLAGYRNQAMPMVRRMRRFVTLAAIAAVVGSLVALAVQSLTLGDGTYLDKVINTLGQTRYGHLWLTRVALVIVLGLVLAACGWWFTSRRQVEGTIAWILSASVVVPFSLIAHASAQTHGRWFAIAMDAVHLVATGIWAGGVMLLVVVVLPALRALPQADRTVLLRRILPRFSSLALICMAIIGLSGFYAGWLHVGNLHALTTTSYGKALVVKLALLLVILGLAGINLLVIERRLREKDATGETGVIWTKRLRWTISGEVIGVILLLVAVGQMTSLQPARDVVVAEARQVAVEFDDGTASATLLMAPGTVGSNHFRLEVDGPTLPAETDAVLRLSMPSRQDLGVKEIPLSRVLGNAFEYHGSELSIEGGWTITAIIREPAKSQVSLDGSIQLRTERSGVDVPGNPWRFDTLGGVTGLGLAVLGLASLVIGLRSRRTVTRKESIGLGAAAMLLAAILLVQARIDPLIANSSNEGAIDPSDVAMVERGEAIYTQQCLSCHGTGLRGDGTQSEGMQPPPADFGAPHTWVHSESDLIYWVRNGKQGTAMPGFGNSLSDEQIADVLSYIAWWQEQFRTNGTPEP